MQTCREQHTALRRLLDEIPSAEPVEERVVVASLRRLRRILSAHLNLEDHWLYPFLEQSSNRVLSRKAARYKTHMGAIAQSFTDLFTAWSSPGAISANPKTFLDQWSALCAALRLRMDSEDEDLYVMAEQILASKP